MAPGQYWHGWDHDHRVSGYWAPRIRHALHGLIPAAALVDTHPGGGRDRARMIARSAVNQAAAARLTHVLVQLKADASVLGAKTALGQARDVGIGKPVPPAGLVTALDAGKRRGWSVGPGHDKYVDTVTLRDWERESAGIVDTVAQSLGDQVARILAAGWEQGASTGTIARDLAVVLDSPARSETIAITETARSMVATSFATYQRNGIGAWDWIESPGACPICLALAAGGPYTLNDPGPPEASHPRCRCAPAPRVDVPSGPIGLTGVPGLDGLPALGGVSGTGQLLAGVAGVITGTLTAHIGTATAVDLPDLGGSDDEGDDDR